MESQMSDNEKVFDNSWEAVWKREINELSERLKYPERYSASEINRMQVRKKELEEAIENRKSKKKDLTGGFAKGRQNINNMDSAQQQALMMQMAGNRAA